MSKQAEAGKGSKPRKQQDQDAYASGYDRIFGKQRKPVNDQTPRTKDNGGKNNIK